jgi:cell surface protein SprA
VTDVAAYLDSTGCFWQGPSCPPQDFGSPYRHGHVWRPLEDFRVMLDDRTGQIAALDMGEEQAWDLVLGVVYDVVDAQGNLVYRVGDRPGQDEDNRVQVYGGDVLHYRMKLLKGRTGDQGDHLNYLCKRNIYFLERENLDLGALALDLYRTDIYPDSHLDENEVPYLRIFGLDQDQADGQAGPDGYFDSHNPLILDAERGLLTFPLEMPFAAGREAYAAFSGVEEFQWEGTYLARWQTIGFYDGSLSPRELEQLFTFTIGVRYYD